MAPGFLQKLTWYSLFGVLVLIILGSLALVFTRGERESKAAVAVGTRAIISITSQEIITRAPVKEAAPPAAETAAEAPAEVPTEATDAAATTADAPAAAETPTTPAAEAATTTPPTPPAENAPAENALPETVSAETAPHPTTEPAKEAAPVEVVAEPTKEVPAPAPQVPEAKVEPAKKAEPTPPPAPVRPRIAVVISNVGLSKSSTDQALQLPRAVSLSFSPYAHNVKERIAEAMAQRREVLVNLPLEPEDYPYTDPGPFGILLESDEAKNLDRLQKVLETGDAYVGVVSGSGERFTEQVDKLKPLLKGLQDRGLLFIYYPKPSNSTVDDAAKEIGTRVLAMDSVVDEEISADGIEKSLKKIEALAKEHGFAVAVARPYPISLRLINEWLGTLEAKGFEAVPVSAAPVK